MARRWHDFAGVLVAHHLFEPPPMPAIPSTAADLCHPVGDIPGTDLPALIEPHCLDPETAGKHSPT